jgi:hypothetical protein
MAGRNLFEDSPVEPQGAGVNLFSQAPRAQQPAALGPISETFQPPIEDAEAEQRKRIEALPEVGSGGLLAGEDPLKVAAISPVLLSTTDPREMANIIATTFPSVGITETPEGEILATNNQTGARVVVNRPGLSKLDVLQGLGIISAFTPAGGAATIPARIGGAVATEAAIQTAQAGTGGEFDPEEVALAGGLGAAAEVVAPAARAITQPIRQARQARQVGAPLGEVDPAVLQAQQAAEATGIQPFEAQATLVPARLQEQAFVSELPAGSKVAREALLKQNEQAAQAVDDILDLIAPPTALETGPERFRSAAIKAKEALKISREEKASPIYRQAFKDKSTIDLEDLPSIIDDKIADFPESGEVSNLLKKTRKFIGGGEKNVKQLHLAKVEIDQIIEKTGEGSVGNITKAELIEIQNRLLRIMDAQNPSYFAARKEFERLSPAVENFKQSTLGKIAKFNEPQLKTISKQIFDPAETNPAIIRNSRKVIEKQDPQAWREIMRTELERRLGVVKADLESGVTIENIPGQLSRAIFGNEKQRKVLFQGSPQDVVKNLRYLETALGRAKLGRPGGSPTATREEVKRTLREGVWGSIARYIRNPLKSIQGAGEDIGFDRRVGALSKALYDPEWQKRMDKIRRMNAKSSGAGRAMLQLLNDIEQTEEQ